jgi:hypothetical protein
VPLGDFVASDVSKYLPNSVMSDDDNDEDKKPKKRVSPLQGRNLGHHHQPFILLVMVTMR